MTGAGGGRDGHDMDAVGELIDGLLKDHNAGEEEGGDGGPGVSNGDSRGNGAGGKVIHRQGSDDHFHHMVEGMIADERRKSFDADHGQINGDAHEEGGALDGGDRGGQEAGPEHSREPEPLPPAQAEEEPSSAKAHENGAHEIVRADGSDAQVKEWGETPGADEHLHAGADADHQEPANRSPRGYGAPGLREPTASFSQRNSELVAQRRAERAQRRRLSSYESPETRQLCSDSVHAAARYGDCESLKKHLSKQTVDSKDKVSFTPLHFAACYGQEDALDMILRAGADTEAANELGWRPLHVAARSGYTECVRALIAAKASVHACDSYKWTPLHSACCTDNVEIVGLLLEAGAAVNQPDNDLWTPLHFAARFNSLDVVLKLLQSGADPNAQDKDGWTATHNTARNGRNKCITLLLEHQADLHLQTRYEETPLHVACRKGKARVVVAITVHAERTGVLADLLKLKDVDGRTCHDVSPSEHIRSILRRENTGGSSYDAGKMASIPSPVNRKGKNMQAKTCAIL